MPMGAEFAGSEASLEGASARVARGADVSISRYLRLAWVCLGALAVLYVWQLRRRVPDPE
jgi:hypothetical protein